MRSAATFRRTRGPCRPARAAGAYRPAGVPALARWRRALSFHPAEQFWTFQAIEAGIFFAFAAALIVATVWSCSGRRRDAPEEPRVDRARLLKSLGVTAAAMGYPPSAQRRPPRRREPASWRPIPAGASWSSTMRRRIHSSFDRYGIQDASRHYGTTYKWTGSTRSDVGEMVKAMRRAIEGGAHGIAVSVIDRKSLQQADCRGSSRGIPVVSYNADGGWATSGSPTSARICTNPA